MVTGLCLPSSAKKPCPGSTCARNRCLMAGRVLSTKAGDSRFTYRTAHLSVEPRGMWTCPSWYRSAGGGCPSSRSAGKPTSGREGRRCFWRALPNRLHRQGRDRSAFPPRPRWRQSSTCRARSCSARFRPPWMCFRAPPMHRTSASVQRLPWWMWLVCPWGRSCFWNRTSGASRRGKALLSWRTRTGNRAGRF
jgi:hypothetical protein